MSQQALTVQNNTPMILANYDQEKLDLVKRSYAKNADNDQLALFLYQADRTGLDPLAKQIHCILRWNSKDQRYDMSIQTAIDGYRLIADRTGKYAGSDDYLFNEGITQYRHLRSGEKFPVTASVTVHKIVGGQRVPFTATAAWDAYYPGDKQGFMWRKMPHLMLGKCAEALALRKAFPAELSGIYVQEEMEQAGFVDAENATIVDHQPTPSTNGHSQPQPAPASPDNIAGYRIGDTVLVQGRDSQKPGTVTALNFPELVSVRVEGNGVVSVKADRLSHDSAETVDWDELESANPNHSVRTAEQVRAALVEAALNGSENAASEKQIKFANSSLNSATNGDEAKRKAFWKLVFGIDSSKDATAGMASATIDWLGAGKDNDYTPVDTAVRELERIYTAFLKAEGQQQLI
jgi:phage recombination protein Bet